MEPGRQPVLDLSRSAGRGITAEHSSRGLAIGDLDNDGDMEVVIVNLNEPPTLLKNFAPRTGNSLLIRLVTTAGSDAIGARATVTTGEHQQIGEVRSGGSFMSQSDFRLHFGVGKASTAEISVRWQDGKGERLPAMPTSQIVTVQEGKGVIRTQPFVASKQRPGH